MADMPLKGALADEQLQIIPNAGIITKNDTIVEVGDYNTLKEKTNQKEVHFVEIEGESVCLPGFIDSHTHICFGGTRANDFAMRNAGKSYLEIAKAGGGIWDTVQQTRKATKQDLVNNIIKRANHLLQLGTTTVEVKSGYGLSVEEELKMLRAIKEANKTTAQQLISTCLAAHTLPKDDSKNHAEYLQHIAEHLFPTLVEEQLTTRIDAFIEEEAFNREAVTPYFNKAKEMGFAITVHADQFSTGGSAIAVDFDAVSADHLEASGDKEIQLLANSNTVATALPGASIGLGVAYTPARKLLDNGASVAIATDWNPGSAPQGNLIMQASCLATYEKLSTAEVFAGITYRAAHALRENNIGQLKPNFKANFVTFPTKNYQEILYQMGRLTPNKVVVNGKLVFQAK